MQPKSDESALEFTGMESVSATPTLADKQGFVVAVAFQATTAHVAPR